MTSATENTTKDTASTAGEMTRIRREVEDGTASDDVVFLHGILVEVAVDRAMDAAIKKLKKTGRLPALVVPRRGK